MYIMATSTMLTIGYQRDTPTDKYIKRYCIYYIMAEKPLIPMRIRKGVVLHHKVYKNADGTPQRWKIISIKTWKRTPWILNERGNKWNNMLIGLKRGLHQYQKIQLHEAYNNFTVPETFEYPDKKRSMENSMFWY